MQRENEVQHVFLVGAKSLGAYGGYETFVYKLTEYHQNKKNIKYHVACKANGDGCMDETKVDGVTRINDHEFEFHNAHCFKIDIPQIGPAQAIYYDVAALKACCKYIKEHRIKHPIVYIMACRIGPFAGHFYKEIHCSKLKPEITGTAHKNLERVLQHKPNYFMDTAKFIKRLATYVAVEHTAFIIPIEDEYGALCGWYTVYGRYGYIRKQ